MEKILLQEDGEEAFFGPFFRFVSDKNVTDIDFDGKKLWLTDISGKRFKADIEIPLTFIEQFSKRVANLVSKSFNKQEPVLEAETDELRITVVHESVAILGRCVCIRKSSPALRMTEKSILETGYCDKETLSMLSDFVRQKKNIVICGEPGAGKTECAKFLSGYISPADRVITIEDTPEWHYGSIFPERDSIELRLSERMGYTEAIKTCLRLNPKWMMLSEARSSEVVYLVEGFSTGVRGFTTIHADDVRKIPDRMINMASGLRDYTRMENDIYSFINVGILVKRDENGKRYICQVCRFDRIDGKNSITMLYEKDEDTTKGLPNGRDIKSTGKDIKSTGKDIKTKDKNSLADILTTEFKTGGTYAGTKSFIAGA